MTKQVDKRPGALFSGLVGRDTLSLTVESIFGYSTPRRWIQTMWRRTDSMAMQLDSVNTQVFNTQLTETNAEAA